MSNGARKVRRRQELVERRKTWTPWTPPVMYPATTRLSTMVEKCSACLSSTPVMSDGRCSDCHRKKPRTWWTTFGG